VLAKGVTLRSRRMKSIFRILASRKLEGEQKLRRVFAVAPIYTWPEYGKALRTGTLATQAKNRHDGPFLPDLCLFLYVISSVHHITFCGKTVKCSNRNLIGEILEHMPQCNI